VALPAHCGASGLVEHRHHPGAVQHGSLVEIKERREHRQPNIVAMGNGVESPGHHAQHACGGGPGEYRGKAAAIKEEHQQPGELDEVKQRKAEIVQQHRAPQPHVEFQR